MTHDDFIKLERTANRAINAAKTFATDSDETQLNKLSGLMAEIRHASQTLSDTKADKAAKESAWMRLAWIFA
jgi:hypothetical protein